MHLQTIFVLLGFWEIFTAIDFSCTLGEKDALYNYKSKHVSASTLFSFFMLLSAVWVNLGMRSEKTLEYLDAIEEGDSFGSFHKASRVNMLFAYILTGLNLTLIPVQMCKKRRERIR